MSLTAKDVAEIVRLLDQSSFDELTLEVGDLRLKLRRGEGGIEQAPESGPEAAPAPADPPPAEAAASATAPAPAGPGEGLLDVPSPLLGVFYRAPKPGAPPFIEVGQRVEPDTIVGIVEVMKLMNSVRAGLTGEVVEIPAANGALVEYGDPLVRVRPVA
jgi:acetyl-CoA carboxylase biotin carboxyl carrier protein